METLKISEKVRERIEYFEKTLHEKYDREVDEEEAEEEMLFEAFFANKQKIKKNKSSYNRFYDGRNIRRDLAEKLSSKDNEPKFRNLLADMLKKIRFEAKNGYKNLTPEKQEERLNYIKNSLSKIFGNDNIYFSRKKYPSEGKELRFLPLRKDIIRLVIRAYKPKGLFEEEEINQT